VLSVGQGQARSGGARPATANASGGGRGREEGMDTRRGRRRSSSSRALGPMLAGDPIGSREPGRAEDMSAREIVIGVRTAPVRSRTACRLGGRVYDVMRVRRKVTEGKRPGPAGDEGGVGGGQIKCAACGRVASVHTTSEGLRAKGDPPWWSRVMGRPCER
jgi:hypothetical protein